MLGTVVNTGAIVAGSVAGIVVGERLPDRIKSIMMQALGLAVLVIGMQMALTTDDMIATIMCLLAGGIIGETIDIERRIADIGEHLKGRFRSNSSTFVDGFLTASVLYLTGAMTIVGSIQDGTVGDAGVLYIKSLLDGVASLTLASSLGTGVLFSAISVFVVQGAITLLASKLLFLQAPAVLSAVTATGGILILGIGINLLDIMKIRIGNLVPAVFLAIIWASIYPG